MARLNRRGVPVRAILVSTAFGYAAVVMNYVSPEHVFAFLVDSYGTVAIFVYLLIAFAELRLRGRLEREAPERLRVRMWAYPALTIVAIVTMCAIVAAMAFIPDQRWPLVFGIVSALVMLCGYAIRRRFGSRDGLKGKGTQRAGRRWRGPPTLPRPCGAALSQSAINGPVPDPCFPSSSGERPVIPRVHRAGRCPSLRAPVLR